LEQAISAKRFKLLAFFENNRGYNGCLQMQGVH
jgi:hypothetical protein